MDVGDKESCKMLHKRSHIYVHTYHAVLQVAYPYIKAVADPVYTGGVILLSMPGIFMWSKDGLPPYTVREMTGVSGNCQCHTNSFFSLLDLMPEQGTVGMGGATGSTTLLFLQGLQTCWTDDQGQQVLELKTLFRQRYRENEN